MTPAEHLAGSRDLVDPQHTNGSGALVDAKVIASMLSVPSSWVLAEARAGRIPHVRLGKYVRFSVAAVEAWWRSHQAGPVPRTGTYPVLRGGGASDAGR